jgi:diaminopimelate decarboxylase
LSRPSSHSVVAHFQAILDSGLVGVEDSAFVCYDFNVLRAKMSEVQQAFGPSAQHTIAVKSNPLNKVLAYACSQGFGLECASFEEVQLAAHAGARLIAWDSPAKTLSEIEASKNVDGLIINADSLMELRSIAHIGTTARVFLRINPLVDTGSHSSMSVGGTTSKFGESIAHREEIMSAILNEGGIVDGLHVHSSSQTADYTKMALGVRKVIDLANEINANQPGTIKTIDIGGGFPVAFKPEEVYAIADYAAALKVTCPELFDGTFQFITEFGRFYHAHAAFTASLIHDVKRFDLKQVLVTHVGADLFLREAYTPHVWYHELLIPKAHGEEVLSDVGGPLCFGGDYIARDMSLPIAHPGQWLIIRDTGANSFALWSHHCSRPFPKIIGFKDGYEILRNRDSFEDILNFWG